MKRLVIGLGVFVSVLLAQTAVAATIQISASGASFTPSSPTINVGDSIKWVKGSLSHTTTSGNGSSDPQVGVLWDADLTTTTPTFTRRFMTEGVFPYFCRPHESSGMDGTISVVKPTGVFDAETDQSLLPILALDQNVPNPFNAQTVIPYSLRRDGQVELVIYDILGRTVQKLSEGEQPAGMHVASWDGRDRAGREVPSGVYFYRLIAGGQTLTRKMVLLR